MKKALVLVLALLLVLGYATKTRDQAQCYFPPENGATGVSNWKTWSGADYGQIRWSQGGSSAGAGRYKYYNWSIVTGYTADPQWRLDGDFANKRVLGFKYVVIGWYNEPSLCLKIYNSANRKVELMVESMQPNARLCATDDISGFALNSPGAVNSCDTGRLYTCFDSPADQNVLNIVIYCDESCEQEQLGIWYRVRMSAYKWDDPDPRSTPEANVEMWCEYAAADVRYPLDLLPDIPSEGYVAEVPKESHAPGMPLLIVVAIATFIATFSL